MTRVLVRLALAGLVAGFAIFVWPTRYRYDRIQMLGETAPGPVFPVRIDRFSGASEILLPAMLGDSRHSMSLAWVGAAGQPLPVAAVEELRRNSKVDTEPLPYVQLLDTTEWRITKTRWALTSRTAADGPDGKTIRTIDQTVFVEPHAVASFYLELGRFGRDVSIALHNAWGVRPDDASR